MPTIPGIRVGAGAPSYTTPRVQPSIVCYRRSDDYILAFSRPYNAFPASATGITMANTQTTTDLGTVRVDYVTGIFSSIRTGGPFSDTNPLVIQDQLNENIALDDPRITASGSGVAQSMNFPTGPPAQRWEVSPSTLQIVSSEGSWAYPPSLPLQLGFELTGSTYTVFGRISNNTGVSANSFNSIGSNGRFVHVSFSGEAYPPTLTCAVDGTVFSTYNDEKAHNSLSFILGGAAESKTFNGVASTVSLGLTNGGALNCVSHSEIVPTVLTARVFMPSIVNASVTIVDDTHIHVDMSPTVSPTASITGARVSVASTEIDHFEVGGVPVAVTGSATYIPAAAFDIVLKEAIATRTITLGLHVTVDAGALPVSSPDTYALNWQMSVPAKVTLTVAGSALGAQMIIRPSGQTKFRDKSHLWQHRGSGTIWAGELSTGAVYQSKNEGATWTLMANAWNGISGAAPKGFASLPFKAAISIANVGGTLKSRYSPDGLTWQAPVTICPFTNGSWSVASREHAGSDGVEVRNNTGSEHFYSRNRGTTWEAIT